MKCQYPSPKICTYNQNKEEPIDTNLRHNQFGIMYSTFNGWNGYSDILPHKAYFH